MDLNQVKQVKQAKTEAVERVHAAKREVAIGRVFSLLEILIAEVREANDTEEGSAAFFRNQGEIRGYKRLHDYIVRGLPSHT